MQLRCVVPALCAVIASHNAFADESTVYQSAQKAGVKKCLPAVKKIADFLIEGGRHGSFDRWNTNNPDKQQFTSTIEQTYDDGAAIANLVVAPVATGECAVAYDRIAFVEKSCMAVRNEFFPKYEYKGEVSKYVTVLTGPSKSAVAFLLPTRTGCVMVKKETLSQAN